MTTTPCPQQLSREERSDASKEDEWVNRLGQVGIDPGSTSSLA